LCEGLDTLFGTMKRVLIIGNPGSGKTTLSVKLSRILNLPVYHLDRYFWRPGWVKPEYDKWLKILSDLVSQDEWIIDGNYGNSLDVRLPRADMVVFLDFKTSICLWRIIRRMLSTHGHVRSDMADHCPEKLDLSFVHYVLKFRGVERGIILKALKECHNRKIITLNRPSEVKAFMERLNKL